MSTNTAGWSSYDNTTQAPVVLPGEGVVRLVPRHLDAETVERAQEWAEYHDDPDNQRAMRRDDEQVQNESLRRWDDYVAACAPTLTSRDDVHDLIAALVTAADHAFPQPCRGCGKGASVCRTTRKCCDRCWHVKAAQ